MDSPPLPPSTPSPSTEFSSRTRPQGPRHPEMRSSSNPLPQTRASTIDTEPVNLGLWTFAHPLDAVPERADSPSSWQTPNLSPVARLPAQPAPLTPPSSLSFDPPPLPYKGLPLSAAEWTFTSSEFQEIVSRAIRQSSSESYIRLLSLSTIDDVLPQEMARLNSLKVITQAKYKFHVHRRTMLLQALNSISLANNRTSSPSIVATEGDVGDQEIEPVISVVSRLTSQLSETTTAMDVLAADLVAIATHQSQISSLMSTHWGSALAIALRKLNSSYQKRSQELRVAAQRNAMLEAEVAEAWLEAERVAGELDALEKFADAIPVFKEPPRLPAVPDDDLEEPDRHPDLDLTGKLSVLPENHEDMTDLYHYADEAVIETANVVSVPQSLRAMSEPTSPAFAVPDASNDKQPEPEPEPEITLQRPLSLTLPNSLIRRQSIDAISSHSTPSICSRRARINAAKKRSSRASLASLRLPVHSRKGSRTGSSVGHGTASASNLEKQLPPLPTMPTMSDSWAAVPKIQRRRSDQDGIPTLSFNPQPISVEQDATGIEVGAKDAQNVPVSLNVPSIPSVWLNPDGPRLSVLKPNASAYDTTTSSKLTDDQEGDTHVGLLRSKSTGEDRVRTLFRHGSESILSNSNSPFARKYPAPSEIDTPSESEADVAPMAFAPNSAPLSAIPSRVVTGSRFYESPSIMSPGNEPPSTPRMQRNGTARVMPGFHMPRLTRFKTMTRKYSLALHPFGIKKAEMH